MIGEVSVRFPGPGIEFNNLAETFKIFGLEISMKGIFVVLALILGFVVVIYEAHSTWQDVEMYINLGICVIIMGITGSRMCYVIHSWNYYRHNILEIFNILNGEGLLYGGIFAAIIPCIIAAGRKKVPALKIIDTMCLGLVLGRAVGSLGEMFGRECFGKFTDSFFSMQIKYDEVKGVVNQEIIDNLIRYDGTTYIQVHPIFLYETVWYLMLFVLLMIFKRFKKNDGDIVLWYIAGFTIGNIIIELFRISPFKFMGTCISLTQFMSAIILIIVVSIYIWRLIRQKNNLNIT